MSDYHVTWNEKALIELARLGKSESRRIENKVNSHLAKAPRELGAQMQGSFAGLYRYRVGDYRVVYDIRELEVIIVIVRVGHRKEVYDV
jgi:mRNA interferase RelE/StbE